MENIGQKKKPCEEKKILRQKWLRKMHLKNLIITYKSRIVQDTTTTKITKKMRNDTFICSKFSLYLRKT